MVTVDPTTFEGIDLSKTALVKNPDGSPPNFENPPNLAAVTYGLCITMIVVSAGFVALRVWTNFRMTRRLPVDDCKLQSHTHIAMYTDIPRFLHRRLDSYHNAQSRRYVGH
jgi:hypothetical protein